MAINNGPFYPNVLSGITQAVSSATHSHGNWQPYPIYSVTELNFEGRVIGVIFGPTGADRMNAYELDEAHAMCALLNKEGDTP